jgi:hypothetical protein
MTQPTNLPRSVRGELLHAGDYAALEKRWLDRDTVEAALLRRFHSLDGAELVGRRDSNNYSGIGIPYIWPGQDWVREWRLRLDHPPHEMRGGVPKATARYLSPPGRSNLLYFAPGTDPALLARNEVPLVLTEGELKTLALWRLAWYSGAP